MDYKAVASFEMRTNGDRGPDVHLYTGLSGLALGWFLLLFVQTVFKKSGWVSKLIAFLAGNALFHGLESEAVYEIYNYDISDEKYTMSGKELMTEGIEISITEAPRAVIMHYNIVK